VPPETTGSLSARYHYATNHGIEIGQFAILNNLICILSWRSIMHREGIAMAFMT
jgi:hypothetical protein